MADNNRNEYNMKEALQAWLKNSRLRQKFDEARLIESWERLMGKPVAAYTESLYIKNHILYVKIRSAPLKNELHMSKTKIIERFDKEIGENVILDIRLL
jgi:hypothetical protein